MQSMSDFPNKMTSLGEVQRIIGLSLSKIQMGRNQRGGLPLHKNLLVATVLNKARDLYMQETMYMNYKMMTGQFGTGPISGVSGMPNNCLVDHGNMSNRDEHEEEMEDTPEHEEYDEDSESDVEDECDITSNTHKHTHLNHNNHYHHSVNQLQNSLTSNASMNMGHASPCTSSMAAAMMMRAAAANANTMAAAAAASAASAASSSLGNSTDNENNSNSGCSSFNALNVNNSAVSSGVVNNCFTQMSSMNMGMHMLQQHQQQQLQQHQQQQTQQQQSQVPGTNNQMQHPQQSHFNSHYAGMMPFFHHQQQMLLHHQQQQQQQQQQQMSNNQSKDDMAIEQSQEEQQQHAAVAAMATQAAQVQAASLAAAAARAAVVNNVAAAAAAASSAISVNDGENHQHKRNASSSASSTSGSSSSSNDEGFIDEPDCDCDTQNFSNASSDVRVPFQYCYHCAPFHPSNGRGPTLVPTPSTTPCHTNSDTSAPAIQGKLVGAKGLADTSSCASDSLSKASSTINSDYAFTSSATMSEMHLTKDNDDENTEHNTKLSIKVSEESSSVSLGSQSTTEHNTRRNDTNNNSSSCEQNFTIYDMDSKSTERRSPCEFPASLRGTKRRRISGCEAQDSLSMLQESEREDTPVLHIESKRRRRSDGDDEDEERSSTSSEEGDTVVSDESMSLKDSSNVLNDSGYHGETNNIEVG